MQIKTQDGTYSVGSNGVANAGLTTGIIGTAGWLLNGGLNGLFNGGNQNNDKAEIAKLLAEKYTDKVGTDIYAVVNQKYNELAKFVAEMDKKNAVLEAVLAERLNCISGRLTDVESLTKRVIPAGNICPPPATTTTGA